MTNNDIKTDQKVKFLHSIGYQFFSYINSTKKQRYGRSCDLIWAFGKPRNPCKEMMHENKVVIT